MLASLTLGQYVPALTGQPAVLAHWAQTVDYYAKERWVAEFYAAATSAERRQTLLRDFAVRYVIQGPAEWLLGDAPLSQAPFLEAAYAAGPVTVYRVKP